MLSAQALGFIVVILYFFILLFFFFSSRRRHTRLTCDWSSDVCSSDLEVGSDTSSFEQALRQSLRQDPDVILVGELRDMDTLRIALRAADTGHQVFSTRSEERRVGKECRSRGAPDH